MPEDKKPMDDWFVGGEKAKQPETKPAPPPKPPAPPPAPAPEPAAKPPGTGRLLAALVLLALLGYGGFYLYRLRFRPSKVEEVLTTPVIPQPGEQTPPPAPVEPIVPPAPQPKKTVVRPAKPPAKQPAPKAEEPVQSPVPQVEPPPPPKPEQPPIPSSGIMLWSGKVEKNGTIVIDSGKSDTGTVNGAALPGVPVTVRVEPKGFTVAEPPSAASGWKRIAIHSQKKAHIVVTVFWNAKQ
jgi:hypothetical protein